MLKKLFQIAALLCLAACVSTTGVQTLTNHDEFSGTTTDTVVLHLARDLSFFAMADKNTDDVNCPYGNVTAGFRYVSALSGDDWRYKQVQGIRVLADGSRFGPLPVDRAGDVQTGYRTVYTEEVLALVKPGVFLKLAAPSNDVRIQIQNDEYEFTPEQLMALAYSGPS